MSVDTATPPRGAAGIIVRAATLADLDAVNAVVLRAVDGWALPERVKRLSRSSYCYQAADLEHMHVLVAADERGVVQGVAALEAQRDGGDTLLHGLFVDPACQRRGAGGRLLEAALQHAAAAGAGRVTVKAWREAEAFFHAHGFRADGDGDVTYPRRLHRAVG